MKHKPKIALVCTEMLPVPPISGGAIQTYIAGVLPELKRRFDITVVGVDHPQLPDREMRQGVRYVRLAKGEGRPDYYREVAIFLASERWDLVEVFNRPAFVEQLAEAAPGARLVLSVHNDMFHPVKIEPSKAERCLDILSVVVTISEFIGQRIAEAYPRHAAKLRPIYSGVDTKEFRPRWKYTPEQLSAARASVPGFDSGPVILTVGRLSKKKGPHILLQAMEQILATHPQAKLLIVGSRWYGSNEGDAYVQAIHEMAKPIQDAVHFTGYVPYDRIASYFLLGDLFVCASQWEEPLARVHYEAMATGLPIITTHRGGNAEVMEEGANGFVLRAYDAPTAFAEAIRQMLDDPQLRIDMGRRGQWLAKKKYSWSRVAADLTAALETALASPPAKERPARRSRLTAKSTAEIYPSTEHELLSLAMNIATQYPLELRGCQLVSSHARKPVWILHDRHRKYLLKRLQIPSARLAFLIHATHFLIDRGVRTPKIIPTHDQQLWLTRGYYHFLLFEFLEGRQPDYSNVDETRSLLHSLATFHNASRGIEIPDGTEPKVHLGRCIKTLESRLLKMERWWQKTRAIADPSPVEELFQETGKTFLSQGSRALELLRESSYDRWVERTEQAKILCHQDFVPRNTRFTEGGELWVYDMDNLTIALPSRDLRKILGSAMHENWNSTRLHELLGYYNEVNSLDREQLKVVAATTYFPYHIYSLISRHFKGQEADFSNAEGSDDDRTLERLDRMARIETEKAQALDEFLEQVV